MSSTPWTLDASRSIARLQAPHLSASLDLSRPDFGLHEIAVNDRPVAGCHLFSMHVPAAGIGPRTDCYVRGDDIIATYAETPQWPVRMQIYWRVLGGPSAAAIAGIEFIASVQTSLLDSRPTVRVESRLGNLRDRMISHDGFILARLAGADASFAQLFDPTDVEISCEDQSIAGTLFQRPLEKGVILRSRLRGWFLPQTGDLATATNYHREFLASEIPLTV
jgi:hypothetical protein